MGSVASAITKAASKQTYYTIRFLVDRDRVQDAYRAYAYFRWVDDLLDSDASAVPTESLLGGTDDGQQSRAQFIHRQRELLECCLRGEMPVDVDPYERMLVDLVRHADLSDGGLEAYLLNMMLVMEFDASRRGRQISEGELTAYTRWLAIAVTEAMHYFIGNGMDAPRDETRYLAVSGAHVLHMLRDTFTDVRAGYFNVPSEMLDASGIGPSDVWSDAYRAWVAGRVELARAYLHGGEAYFTQVESARHRFAGLAYIARFAWMIDAIEKDDFRLRVTYDQRRSPLQALRMGWFAASRSARIRALPRADVAVPRGGGS